MDHIETMVLNGPCRFMSFTIGIRKVLVLLESPIFNNLYQWPKYMLKEHVELVKTTVITLAGRLILVR